MLKIIFIFNIFWVCLGSTLSYFTPIRGKIVNFPLQAWIHLKFVFFFCLSLKSLFMRPLGVILIYDYLHVFFFLNLKLYTYIFYRQNIKFNMISKQVHNFKILRSNAKLIKLLKFSCKKSKELFGKTFSGQSKAD